MLNLERFALAVSVFAVSLCARAEQLQQLVIATTSGIHTSYSLEESPQIRFSENLLIIETSKTTIEIPVKEVDQIYYKTIDQSGIPEVNSKSDDLFEIINRELIIYEHSQNCKVDVFDINGQPWISQEMRAGSDHRVSLVSLPNGIYLIKINSSTHKLILK